jgi:hypothetical protein
MISGANRFLFHAPKTRPERSRRNAAT